MRSSGFSIGVLLGLMLLSLSCVKETNTSSAQWDQTPYLLEKGSLPDPKLPSDNPLTVQKVRLGRMLFHEKKLSLTTACPVHPATDRNMRFQTRLDSLWASTV